MFVRAVLSAAAGLGAIASANAAVPTRSDTAFMEFPLASELSGAEAPAFAWLVRKGSDSMVMFAEGPDFKPVKLFSQSDVDGQPVTSVRLSPDGRHLLFQTGSPFAGGRAYNPASLLDPPKPLWWMMETRAGAKPVAVSPGAGFSEDGRQLLFRKDRDMMSRDLTAPDAKPVILAPGAAGLGRPVWSADRKTLYFVQDRGGYSFLGRYRLGSDRIDWLVTGADRLTAPTLSPDGKTVAYLRFPGRDHDTMPNYTESEPFALETVDIATGRVRELWHSTGKASAFGIDDPDSQIRWIGNDRILFFSEQDGWARLYGIPSGGGEARAVTPPNCEAAESELIGADTLVVAHNCHDIDTRQISFFNARTGQERVLQSNDMVMANVALAGGGRYIGYVGGDADNAPLVRVYDNQAKKVVMAERPSDYGFSRGFTAPKPQVVRIKATDGGTVPAQLFLPSTKGPHPALVYVHGGPPRQMYPAFHYMGYYANDYAANRRLAELGYVVVSINYRSGIGYGRDYREAPKRGWQGASEYADVLGAGRWLAEREDVDKNRIGIWGGSYGGLLTGQALARNSDLFKAGVAIHGVYDWSWPSPKEGHQNPSRLFGVGPNDRELARASSPVAYIDGWRSPVLLFSGDQDMNVDVLETVDLTQKLRAHHVDVRTVLIPGEAHDFVRHSTWQRLWDEQQKFLAEKLDTAK